MRRRRGAIARRALLPWAALAAAAAGCASDRPLNPSFPLTHAAAQAALRQMSGDPLPLQRPVVVAGGLHDPGLVASGIARKLRKITAGGSRIITASFFGFSNGSFDECRDRLIARVEESFPSGDADQTTEVDVIGYSMGGLVARHAARRRRDGGKRLRIRHLFTISAPHRGARLAGLPTLDRRQIDMRRGSAFLAGLDADLARADFEIYPYTRLSDLIVGAQNTAPPGQEPWWVANGLLSASHLGAGHDPRILADIARRLRGEVTWTSRPAAALPGTEPAEEVLAGP